MLFKSEFFPLCLFTSIMREENYRNFYPCFCPQTIVSYFIYRGVNPTSEMYISLSLKIINKKIAAKSTATFPVMVNKPNEKIIV